MHIAAAASLLTPAYLTLIAKGYAVRSEGELLIATKGGDTFVAEDPILLLGVVSVGEIRGENWQATDAQIDDFLSAFGS